MLVKDVLEYSHGPICWKCGKCYPQEKSQPMQPWISVGKTNCIICWTERDSTDDWERIKTRCMAWIDIFLLYRLVSLRPGARPF